MHKEIGKKCSEATCKKWLRDDKVGVVSARISLDGHTLLFEYCSHACFNQTLERFRKNSSTLAHGNTTLKIKDIKMVGGNSFELIVEPVINIQISNLNSIRRMD